MGGRGGVRGTLGAQINFGDLTSYLTYELALHTAIFNNNQKTFVGHFCLPGSGYGSNRDLDPQH
jgi:hypothetical protein